MPITFKHNHLKSQPITSFFLSPCLSLNQHCWGVHPNMCVLMSHAQYPPFKIECHRIEERVLLFTDFFSVWIKHKAPAGVASSKWVGITFYVLCIDTRIGLALNLKFTAFKSENDDYLDFRKMSIIWKVK